MPRLNEHVAAQKVPAPTLTLPRIARRKTRVNALVRGGLGWGRSPEQIELGGVYVQGGAEPFLTLPVRTGGAESMKKRKMPDPEVVGNIPFISEAATVGGTKARKARASLNRAALAMLGKCLQDYLEEVRRQEVPERFKLLLRQF